MGQIFKSMALLNQLSTENALESAEACTNALEIHVLLVWFQPRSPHSSPLLGLPLWPDLLASFSTGHIKLVPVSFPSAYPVTIL